VLRLRPIQFSRCCRFDHLLVPRLGVCTLSAVCSVVVVHGAPVLLVSRPQEMPGQRQAQAAAGACDSVGGHGSCLP
jgi:hypothetical protein